MISKKNLLDFLWDVVNEKPEALATRSVAAKEKNKYWKADEWIYIKDTEVALKMLLKDLKKANLTFAGSISGVILDGTGEEFFSRSEWALEKIKECRSNMRLISNPD